MPVDVNAVHALSAAARAGTAAGDVDPGAARDPWSVLAVRVAVRVGVAIGSVVLDARGGCRGHGAAHSTQRPGVPAFRVGGGPPHPITGRVLIGRRPLAPRIPDAAGGAPQLVTVPSPRAVVSGTHLELRLEGTRLVATDLKSTNGTIVRGASGSRRMRAGESIVVAPGSSLDLGDDTIIEILLAPEVPPESTPTRQQAAP